MEKVVKYVKRISVLVVIAFFAITFSCICFAGTIYTNKLNEGDKLKLIGDTWNIYSSKKIANEANASKAIGTIKKGETYEILEIDSNVVKIGNKQYIYYGRSASQNFKTIPLNIKEISLNERTIVLKEGETFKLYATVNSNIMNYQDVKWESSQSKVAGIDSNGLVTAKKEGEVLITATPKSNSNIKAHCIVFVRPTTLVKFKNDVESLNCNDEIKITKILNIKNAEVSDIEFSSSDEKVVAIENGIIKAKKTGTAVITAKIEDIQTSCTIMVFSEEVVVKKLTLSPKSKTLNAGEKFTLIPTIKVVPDKSINKKLQYISSDENIATVSASGVVKAVNPGKATITVKSLVDETKTATCILTVKQQVKSVNVLSSKEVKEGESFTLQAEILPENASNKKVTWTSSNTKVATVNKNGVVKGIKAGTVKIRATATDGSKKYGECTVTVKSVPKFQGVELKYSERYNVCKKPLTKKMGVKYYNGHKETFYSQKVLSGKGLKKLNENGKHVSQDGTIRDKDGYIAVACNYLPQGSKIMTSLGPGKVYDTGDMTGAWIDIYVNW